MSKQKSTRAALDPDELAQEQVSDLPKREVMTLLDPNAVGGSLLGDPTAGATGSTGATGSDPTQSGSTTDPTAGATTTATQGPQLAGGYLPNPSQVAGQTYQPSATSTAQS